MPEPERPAEPEHEYRCGHCGAAFADGSDEEDLAAVMRHLAEDHPEG